MNYAVKHIERYVPVEKDTNYASLDALLERYPVSEATFLQKSQIPTESGVTVTLQYDHYIVLALREEIQICQISKPL